MRIEHFAIYAEDTVALSQWYCDKFGLKEVFRGTQTPPMIFVADNQGMAIEMIGRSPRDKMDFTTIFHFAFLVDDFDQTVAELKEKGVPIEDEVVGAAPGVRLCFFDDPAGNRGQIAWRSEPLGS